jgi:hypothetical protein
MSCVVDRRATRGPCRRLRADERDQPCDRIGEPLPQRVEVRLAADKGGRRHGQRDGGEFVDGSGLIRQTGGFKEGVTRRPCPIERCGQRPTVRLRAPADAPLDGAHGMDGQTGDGRQFVLREFRRGAKRLEPGAK